MGVGKVRVCGVRKTATGKMRKSARKFSALYPFRRVLF